jgi:hypothetical protein
MHTIEIRLTANKISANISIGFDLTNKDRKIPDYYLKNGKIIPPIISQYGITLN